MARWSALWSQKCSRKQVIARCTATRVPLSMCGYPVVAPSRMRVSSSRDWQSVQLETETSSRNLPCEGKQASRSILRMAGSLSSPETMSTTRQGMPRDWQKASLVSTMRCISASLSLGAHTTNCSTFSNWCTRNSPWMSFPCAPASRRKQLEYPPILTGSRLSSRVSPRWQPARVCSLVAMRQRASSVKRYMSAVMVLSWQLSLSTSSRMRAGVSNSSYPLLSRNYRPYCAIPSASFTPFVQRKYPRWPLTFCPRVRSAILKALVKS